MKTLIQYILESISSSELFGKLDIKEVKIDENSKILDKDDNVKKFGIDNVDEIFLYKYSKHYQLIYDNECLGIFAVYDFNNYDKDFKNISNDDEEGQMNRYVICKFLCAPFENPKFKFSDFLNNSIYVTYLLMLSDIQHKLDINATATIKVFFDKLKTFCKKLNKKYIIANGKNQKTTALYSKCGNFKLYSDVLPGYKLKLLQSIDKNIVDTCVMYELK